MDPGSVWGGEWGRSRDGCIRGGRRAPSGRGREVFLVGVRFHWFQRRIFKQKCIRFVTRTGRTGGPILTICTSYDVFPPKGVFFEGFVDISSHIGSEDHQIYFVGGPETRQTNPRWRTAAILKMQNRGISATVLPILILFDTVMHWDPHDSSAVEINGM